MFRGNDTGNNCYFSPVFVKKIQCFDHFSREHGEWKKTKRGVNSSKYFVKILDSHLDTN